MITRKKHLSKKHRQLISNALRGENSPLYGIPFTDEHRQKIGESKKGHAVSKATRRKISRTLSGRVSNTKGMKGVWHLSKNTKRKMHIARKGKNNPSWLGGISKLPYSFDFDKELKALIRKRDKRTCQLCSKRKRADWDLPIHHIDYNKQNSNPENLITLCRSCNSKVNNNRKLWTKFFKRKLKLLKIS